jgi:hypothetical protein
MFYEACVKGSSAYLREKDRIVGILLYWMSPPCGAAQSR